MSDLSRTPTLYERFEALNRATSQEAAVLAAQGQRTSWRDLTVTPFVVFLGVYIKRGAWRNGVAGLIDATFSAYAVFVRQVKVWEMYNTPEKPPPPPPPRV